MELGGKKTTKYCTTKALNQTKDEGRGKKKKKSLTR